MRLIKIKLNILLNTKEIKQTLNLTTILGQQGVNMLKFNTNIESIISTYFLNSSTYKFPLNIFLNIFFDKNFEIFIKNFNSNFLIKHFFFFKKNVLLKNCNQELKFLNDEFQNFKFNFNILKLNLKDLFYLHTVLKKIEKPFFNFFKINFHSILQFKKLLNQMKTSYNIKIFYH